MVADHGRGFSAQKTWPSPAFPQVRTEISIHGDRNFGLKTAAKRVLHVACRGDSVQVMRPPCSKKHTKHPRRLPRGHPNPGWRLLRRVSARLSKSSSHRLAAWPSWLRLGGQSARLYIHTSPCLGRPSASAADRAECCGTRPWPATWPSAAADLCQVRKQAEGEACYGEALTGWQMMAAMSGVSGLKSPTLANGGLA
jgi:hypothetical protein